MLSFTHRPASKAGAPRLALIHSLALDRRVWDGVVSRLEGDVELLAYDCRGHGQSPKSPAPYTAPLFARDLAELFDTVGWTRAAVTLDLSSWARRRGPTKAAISTSCTATWEMPPASMPGWIGASVRAAR